MIKAHRVEKLNAYEKYTVNKIHQKSGSVKSGTISYLQKLTVSHGKNISQSMERL